MVNWVKKIILKIILKVLDLHESCELVENW